MDNNEDIVKCVNALFKALAYMSVEKAAIALAIVNFESTKNHENFSEQYLNAVIKLTTGQIESKCEKAIGGLN